MSLINGDTGSVSHSASFFGTRGNTQTENVYGAPVTVRPKRSSDGLSDTKLPVPPGGATEVQKKADKELAGFLADMRHDIGMWRQPSADTSVGHWLSLYNQSWEAPAVKAWVGANNLVPGSLVLLGSTLTAQKIVDGRHTSLTFNPADGSGWWPIGRQVIASAAILDPQKIGLVAGPRASLWPEDVTAFYGSTWPLSNTEANQFWTSGFPEVDAAVDPLRSPLVREQAAREFMDTEQEAALIKTVLSAIKDKPEDEKVELGAILQDITPGSSFDIANKSKPQLLKNLRDHPQMISILQAHQADWTTQVRLTEGELFIKSRGKAGQWHNVTKEVRAHASLATLLDNAIEQAKNTGNIINSGAKADAMQLLRFSGVDALSANVSVKELQNLLNWRLNPLPPGVSLGNYARDFLVFAQSPEYLSTEQRVSIRRSAPGENAQPTLTVLDCSPQPWLGRNLEQIRENADQIIAQSLAQGAGLGRSDPIVTALKGDHSSATGDASPSYRQQMILTRDLLRIDPELGMKRNHIAGYNVYSASNTGKTLSEVRTALEQHIATSKGLSISEAVLITHALLATVAPEFLVKGAGEERVGSLALVNLRTQTSLAELAVQGSSREMSTEQVNSRSLLTPLSDEHEQLQALEAAGPIYDWALAQGIVTPEEDYSPVAVKRALTGYNQRLDEYQAMSRELDSARSTIATRLELGKQEFARICPGHDDFFNKPMIYAEPDSILYQVGKATSDFGASLSGGGPSVVDGQRVSTGEHIVGASSIYDLYLSGELTAENAGTRQWKFTNAEDRVKFQSLTSTLSMLKPINEVFDDKIDVGLEHLEKFKLMSARIMMSEMPLEDRLRLEFGEVHIYGVSANQTPGGSELTQERAQQSIGPILYAKDASGAQCYEFLPSSNSYILRPDLLPGLTAGKNIDMNLHKNSIRLRKRHHPALPADLDIKEYFPAKAQHPAGAARVPNSYSSTRTDQMIKVFKDNHLLINRQLMREDAKGLTHNESIQQRFDAAESFIVNTLVPFKGNLEDIFSGDAKRAMLGALGLGLEVVGTLFVVAGAAKAAAKGASVAYKLTTFAKAAMSMFNLPGAVWDTGKSVYRLSSLGIRRVGNAMPGHLAKGIADFRKLVGSNHKPWTLDDTLSLASNVALINTGNGTNSFAQQPRPRQSPGNAVA